MLDQTIASRDPITALLTRGPLVDAGAFKNIVHNHDVSKAIFFGLRYHLHPVKGKIGKIGTYPPGSVELTIATGKRSEDVVLREYALFDLLNRPFLRLSLGDDDRYALASEAFKLTKPKEREAVSRTKPTNFLFSPNAVFRRLQTLGEKKKGEQVSLIEPSRAFNLCLSALAAVFGEVNDLFHDLTYVGPLREWPHRYYPISGEMPTSVGSRGEHMANLVRRRFAGDQREAGRMDSPL